MTITKTQKEKNKKMKEREEKNRNFREINQYFYDGFDLCLFQNSIHPFKSTFNKYY